MKKLAFLLATICVAGTGCESWSNATGSVRDKLAARDESRTKSFVTAPRAAYEAVRMAAGQMGYRFIRGGAAQGEFEAISSLGTNESLRSARQVAMKVRIHAAVDGGTEITVRLTEIIESDSINHPGQATESPLRDTPQYEVFFRSVQQAIDAGRKSE